MSRFAYSHRITDAFLVLLRAGLWEKDLESLSCFPLTAKEWLDVYQQALCQTVSGIVYRGIIRLPDELIPPEDILLRWVVRAEAIQQRNRHMNEVVNELCSLFKNEEIRTVLQKGQGIASLYEYPLMRECGDIDLYFPSRKERNKADLFVRQQGIQTGKGADGSIHYDWKGVIVEHHSRLLDLYSPFRQDYLNQLEKKIGFTTVRLGKEEDGEVTVAAPVLYLLMLNVHILKHALGLGVGLRQLCDMARAYYKWHATMEKYELCEIYRKTGLVRWSNLLHSALREYLGVPVTCLPDDRDKQESPWPLFHIIQQGGNFGRSTGCCLVSGTGWQRKLFTAQSFFRNGRFIFRYAPWEYVGMISTLLKGQVR